MGSNRISAKECNNSSCISVIGEINVSNAENFKSCLKETAENSPNDMLIDFSELTYIDSQGLNVLAYLYNELHKQNRRIIIVNANKTAKRLLHITGFDRIMLIEDQ